MEFLRKLDDWEWRVADKLRDWWNERSLNVKIFWWIITHLGKDEEK